MLHLFDPKEKRKKKLKKMDQLKALQKICFFQVLFLITSKEINNANG